MKVYVDQNMMYEAESICKMWIKAWLAATDLTSFTVLYLCDTILYLTCFKFCFSQEVQKPNALAQLALLAYLQILVSVPV